ncbi:MAG: xanthine dehydrogenase accessory protein XdhC [Akkermansiaceae bacterium]|nr:xanthine dehydrogenase accessory protein XdhC [Akkermansiaceae bacterium]
MSANPSLTILEQAAELDRAGLPFAMVTLVESLGSAPQDAGARMIVTPNGLHAGTVGGGKVEAKAIAHAMEMLSKRSDQPELVNWTLKGDVGMTCGGSVKFFFETHHAHVWRIVIFGAGHVTQALVPVLLPLKCYLTVFDTRADWLEKLPAARNLSVMASDCLADEVDALPDDIFLICMTQGHSTDLPVIARALTRKQFPYIGVIGSKAKAAVLKKELQQAGVPEERAGDFHCPIGLDFGNNDPNEIALSIAAQLLTIRG